MRNKNKQLRIVRIKDKHGDRYGLQIKTILGWKFLRISDCEVYDKASFKDALKYSSLFLKTERRYAERALQMAEAYYNGVIEVLDDEQIQEE